MITRNQIYKLILSSFIRWLHDKHYYYDFVKSFKPAEKSGNWHPNTSLEEYVLTRLTNGENCMSFFASLIDRTIVYSKHLHINWGDRNREWYDFFNERIRSDVKRYL